MAGATENTLVLVTGAGGYIATHIIKQLQEEGYRVRGTLRSLENEEKVKHLKELCPEAEHQLELVEADLTKPESWEPAVKDVVYVIHAASPQAAQPKDENELIQPAVEGTQAILKACVAAKSVKRVVMTSSSVAICWGQPEANKVYTEEDWMEAEKLDAFGKSKTMAEKAAWDYVKELADEDKIELAVINPAYVMGPALNGDQCTSMDVVKRLLERNMPFVPKLNFPVVDVRDVAAAHIKAMQLEEASGKRHLIVNANMWLKEIAQLLAKEFKPQGYNIPTTNCPNAMLHIAGLFDKSVKVIIPQCGKVYKFDNTRMKEVLGVSPREAKETLIDMAYSMIEGGQVKKSKKYKGPNAAGEEDEGEKGEEEGEKKENEEEKKEGETGEEKPKENGDVKEGDKIEDDLKKEGDEKKEEKDDGENKDEEGKKEVEVEVAENKPEEKKAEEATEGKSAE